MSTRSPVFPVASPVWGVVSVTGAAIELNVATNFTGNISNSGTTTAKTAISIAGSTVHGQIIDLGIIDATGHGIAIDSSSLIVGGSHAVFVDGSTFTGGISNAGEIQVLGHGIQIGTSTTPVVSYWRRRHQ